MKRILLLTAFLIPTTLWGQTVINSGFFNQMTNYRGGIGIEELLAIPYGDTATKGAVFNGSYRMEGRIMIHQGNNKMYLHDGDKWVPVSSQEILDAFIQGGNEFGETAVLGTNDDESVELIANGVPVIRLNPDNTIQFLDGTEGDGKVLMSSADGTISAQSADSIVNNSRAWVNGVKNFGTTQAVLGADSDTLSLRLGNTLLMQADNSGRVSFGDILRNGRNGIYFKGVGGSGSQPAITFEGTVDNSSGTKNSVLFTSNTPTSVTTHNMISIQRSTGSTTSSFVGIFLNNWAAGAANTHYGIHSGDFSSGANNWFLYSPNPVKSRLEGNLLLGGSADNGYKLQVTGDVSIVNGSEGAGKVLTSSADGKINIVDPADIIGQTAFIQGGNAFGGTAILGTTDNEALELTVNENTIIRLNTDNSVQIIDGTEGDGKVIMSSADGTISAQDLATVVDNFVWKWKKITYTGNILTAPELKGELSMLVYLNDVPVDWEAEGAVHDPVAGTLNMTAMGGMDGTIIFQYRNLQD